MKLLSLPVILLCLIFTACDDKTEEAVALAESIEFYLLSSYENETNSCAIKESTAVIEATPLLEYDDLKYYDQEHFTFQLTENAASKVFDNQDFSLHQKAFAVCADKKIIYTGYFWAAYSSLSCKWTVIDPINYGNSNTLRLSSVYPGFMIQDALELRYNHPVLIGTFKRDGKLID